MSATPPIVAFLGPSLTVREAAAILPGARFEPPVRRGDLARARNEGAALLLVVDGQFHHEDALPVREVIEVARDGALVYGAASMGALRAAECWPVGVRGVGLVYRLFRSGCLDSDDEVAVATDPDDGFRATSIALVNVRYAAARARRTGLLDRSGALALVGHARDLYYAERTWASVLGPWHGLDSRLARFCAGVDVKRDDALKLCRTAASVVTADPALVKSHERGTSVPLAEKERQHLPDPLAGRSTETLSADLARWMVGAGRYRLDRQPMTFSPLGTWETLTVNDAGFPMWLWDQLTARGDLDAELMRMQAVDEAVAEAERRQLGVRAVDRYLAETEIAARYRCRSWDEMQRVAEAENLPRAWMDTAAHRLALAKRVRAELVSERSPTPAGLWPEQRA